MYELYPRESTVIPKLGAHQPPSPLAKNPIFLEFVEAQLANGNLPLKVGLVTTIAVQVLLCSYLTSFAYLHLSYNP